MKKRQRSDRDLAMIVAQLATIDERFRDAWEGRLDLSVPLAVGLATDYLIRKLELEGLARPEIERVILVSPLARQFDIWSEKKKG